MTSRLVLFTFCGATALGAACENTDTDPSQVDAASVGMAAGSGSGAGGSGSAGSGSGGTSTGTGGTAGAGTGTGGTMTLPTARDGAAFGELVPMFAAGYCAAARRCVPKGRAFLPLDGTNCETEEVASLVDGELFDLQSAIDAGRILFDPTKVEACLASLEVGECATLALTILHKGICEDLITGTVAEGDDCTLDAECMGATFCDRNAGCPGACTAQRAAGGACEEDDQCVAPLSCDGDTDKCVMTGKAGDACQGDVAPDCALGFVCAVDDPADMGLVGVCNPIDEVFSVAEGVSCSSDAEILCAEGLSCGFGPGAHTCVPTIPSDGTCADAIPLQCRSGEYCDGLDILAGVHEGICTLLPREGSPCVSSQLYDSCAPGLVCDMDDLCHPIGRLGDACMLDQRCASDRCVAGRCERPAKCESP